MKTYLYIIIGMLSISLVTSCDKGKEEPTINITSPGMHSMHKWGDEMHIVGELKDNEELKSYKMFIANENGEQQSEFQFTEESEISGTEYSIHSHFDIPKDIEMVYYLHIEALDASDNKATKSIMLHFEE